MKSSSKEIGGYFELELADKGEYHFDLLALNSGRNSLEYILRIRKYKNILLPYFTCDAVIDTIKKLKIEYRFYSINEELEIDKIEEIAKNIPIILNNFFGLKTDYIHKIYKSFKYVIIDNAQAFFSQPIPDIDTFYSPRKFFGVPDGGYVSMSDHEEKINLKYDNSALRMRHLLERKEGNISSGYLHFKKNEELIDNLPVMLMSKLTQGLLSSINYNRIFEIRNKNFRKYHKLLKKYNQFNIPEHVDSPISYPLNLKNHQLREILINHKIYIPLYWPNVLVDKSSLEYSFATDFLHLPIDHRVTENDIEYIVNLLLKNVKIK